MGNIFRIMGLYIMMAGSNQKNLGVKENYMINLE